MATESPGYAARLDIDYPGELDRLTTFFRIIWFIPIGIIFSLVAHAGETLIVDEAGRVIDRTGGMTSGIAVATALMIVFRQRYPRWWFDFQRELARFGQRVFAYLALMTDRYPSTVDEQSVHLELDYPDVERDLNRWLPLFKWFLVIPHIIVLAFLIVAALLVVIVAWFAILLTGRYPRELFGFVVGVFRWGLRVVAYAFFFVTDEYPPFSLS
jgi:hypothetical protein